jgi:hypothetical protein
MAAPAVKIAPPCRFWQSLCRVDPTLAVGQPPGYTWAHSKSQFVFGLRKIQNLFTPPRKCRGISRFFPKKSANSRHEVRLVKAENGAIASKQEPAALKRKQILGPLCSESLPFRMGPLDDLDGKHDRRPLFESEALWVRIFVGTLAVIPSVALASVLLIDLWRWLWGQPLLLH